jgi:hypothetical protein
MMGKLYKIVSFTFRLTTDIAIDITSRVLDKIVRMTDRRDDSCKNKYHDAIHDE